MKKFSSALLLLAVAVGAIGCTPIKKGEYASGSATIYCDDGFKNILEEEIEVFEYTYPNASIIPFYVSEGEAIDTLLADGTQAIISTREFTKEQIEFMKAKYKRVVRQNCIAVDAVAIITNKKNPVTALSMTEVGDILNGRITKWSQLAGNDTTAIKIVFDNAESSTVSYLKDKFLPEGKKISDTPNTYAQNNNAAVFDVVKTDPDALGVISVSWLGDDLSAAENDLNPVSYKPYQAYIYSGDYPLARKVYMISTASNSTVLHSFYVFMTGFVGQKIITKTGILPFHMHPRMVELI